MLSQPTKRIKLERDSYGRAPRTLNRVRRAQLEYLEALRSASRGRWLNRSFHRKESHLSRPSNGYHCSVEWLIPALKLQGVSGSSSPKEQLDNVLPELDVVCDLRDDLSGPATQSLAQLDGQSRDYSPGSDVYRSPPRATHLETSQSLDCHGGETDDSSPYEALRTADSFSDRQNERTSNQPDHNGQVVVSSGPASEEHYLIPPKLVPKLTIEQPNTVVHRIHPRQRCGILNTYAAIPLSPISTLSVTNTQITDGSGNLLNSSLSPRDISTAPTSVESIGKATAAVGSCDAIEAGHLAPIQEITMEDCAHEPMPSIYTAEATANAKCFLEAHFNSLLGQVVSPREARQIELEARLSSGSMPVQIQDEQRLKWLVLENNHLRLVRASKAREVCSSARGRSSSTTSYTFTKTLGKGSFGVVRLAKRKQARFNGSTAFNQRHYNARLSQHTTLAGEVCAIKIIRKSDMLRNTQEAHIKAERDVLAASVRSRWVVPLIESFQDRTNLYLVMEFMVGGDFLGLLIRWDKLEERYARFYVAEMILCVEEAHRLGYIHRDVKPDNFLISASGHLKISDFGLAFDGHWSHDQGYYNYQRYSLLDSLGITITGDETDHEELQQAGSCGRIPEILVSQRDRSAALRHGVPSADKTAAHKLVLDLRNRRGRRNLARSVVGTSQYMAPEVIRGDDYDGRCDWWSIGIILFECLYGETPFIGKDRQETKYNIVRHTGDIQFVPNARLERRYRVSKEARDLVNRLLQEKEARLSCPAYMRNDLSRLHKSRQELAVLGMDEPSDMCPRFLYPDDAADIKAHSFFASIDWEHLHLLHPPEIPTIRHELDTKYFDQGTATEMSTDSLSSSIAVVEHGGGGSLKPILPTVHRNGQLFAAGTAQCLAMTAHKAGHRRRKAQKRPRDCILRDKEVAKDAMKVRKAGAFLGYAYRRPTELLSFLDNLDGTYSTR